MLTEHRHQFPLGRHVPPDNATGDPNDRIMPFGLKYAVTPHATVDVDFSALSYDADRQIAVVDDDGTLIPAMRHTSTKTKTHTGDRSSGDSDTDTTGD